MNFAAFRLLLTHLATAALLILALTQAVSAQTPLTFSKSFSPSTIGPGSVSTLRFDVSNNTSTTVVDLAFVDNLPSGVVIATPANATSTCEGLLDAEDGGGTITFGDGRVGANLSCSISVDVTSSTAGTFTNVSGDLTSNAGNSGSATADLTVATDRPGFLKSFSPSTVFFGNRSTLTLKVDNTANSASATNLGFTDNLPVGMEVASPANAGTTCTGGLITAIPGGSVLSYAPTFQSDASVGAKSSCSVTVDVIGAAVGQLENISGELTSTPQSGSPTRSSGTATATLGVTIDQISLVKSFTDDPVAPGETVNLEFTIRNLNRRSDATGITFTDDLDAVFSGLVATGTPPQDPCGQGSQLTGTNLLTLTDGTLAPEGVCTFSVTLQLPADAETGTFTNTTSEVSADVDGRPTNGNPASDLLFVSAAPKLTKTFIGDPVGAGGSVDLEFTITNTSQTSSATDIAFEDIFDVVIPGALPMPADGFCGPDSSADFTPLIDTFPSSIPAKLTVSGASLDPGQSCAFSITLEIAVGASNGTYSNTTSEIRATLDGEAVVGNAASDSFVIVAGPSLLKKFTDDPVAPGDTVTLEFTLAHDEFAQGGATGISFTDDLNTALADLQATGLPLTDVCGVGSQIDGTQTLTFSGGSLEPGESCAFSVTLQVPATAPIGKHTNTTSGVVATVLGAETTGNPAADDLEIAGLALTKEFTDDPVLPGGTVNLRFTIENVSADSAAADILFDDELREVLAGLTATGLPLTDICGTGSTLNAVAGETVLQFRAGSLAPQESCTFDVTLLVPAAAVTDTYVNRTKLFSATVDDSTVFFDNASDDLIVNSEVLELGKEFIDDPVGPGDTVTLRFTLDNLAAQPASNLTFSDDLGAALPNLVATGLPVAACGGTVSGTTTISFSGGSLAADGSCTFDISLSVPTNVQLGTVATNITSELTGAVDGLGVTGSPATDDLRIDFLDFGKAFDGPALAGGTTQLSFTIRNLSNTDSVVGLVFSDDLDEVIPGLTANGLPASDICGAGSELSGTSSLTLLNGSLLPGGSCTFSAQLQVPLAAVAGDYENVTSELLQFGVPVAAPAAATLTVMVDPDQDDDGVLDSEDMCLGTSIPEAVPTVRLGTNRFALVDDDLVFDTEQPAGGGPGEVFTTTDTAGCSCEQIIEAQSLGSGHTKFGCSLGVMREWVGLVQPKLTIRRTPGRRH